MTIILVGVGLLLIFGLLIWIARMYRKAHQGQALVRTGVGGIQVGFSGILVFPVLHKLEIMDITLKTIVISRTGSEGLICQDNMRADIKVTFFLRVNQTKEDVAQVAQSIGAARASDQEALELLFDAKFSEALKTVGKQFDFVELYNSREKFKNEILNIIGTDLNGYILDDAAIDFLEQTPITSLDERNILDAEGIKKITELTATQKVKSNMIEREKEKTIKKQDVEARETILELERQQAEAEEKQRREIEVVRARERAETEKIREEERLRSERARIATEEEIQIAEQNREREVLVAEKNKLRTDGVEQERVEKARSLEATQREREVELAQIEKEKALEVERKQIQDVIAERVAVEKSVVEEEEKIKDTRAHAEADRQKAVAIKLAEKEAEEELVKKIKSAEAAKEAAEHLSKQAIIDAEAEKSTSAYKAEAKKTLAEAEAAEYAAKGLAEAQVLEAKAAAKEKQADAEAAMIESTAEAEAKGIRMKGIAEADAAAKIGEVEAVVLEQKGSSEAKIIDLKADAEEKRGMAEARVMAEKFGSEAKGLEEKARAMSALDGPGKDHEEFKLQLEKDKAVQLADIEVQREIALSQAQVLSEAMKAANIEIIGGESMFFNQILQSVGRSKSVDRLVGGSEVLTEVKDTFFSSGSGEGFKEKLSSFISQFGLNSDDVRNLSISALLLRLMNEAEDEGTRKVLKNLSNISQSLGIQDQKAGSLGLL